MNSKLNQKLILGAASMAAGLIKTLTSAVMPRKKTWPEKAKDAANQFVSRSSQSVNKKVLLGTLAGGIIGVTTALLLAPKSGAALINDLYKKTNGTKSAAARKAKYQPKKGNAASKAKAKKTVKTVTS